METRPDGSTVERYDNQRCAGCQALLVTPHVLISHTPCSCPTALEAGGHRSITCLSCRQIHLEPPCERPSTLVGGAGYFRS